MTGITNVRLIAYAIQTKNRKMSDNRKKIPMELQQVQSTENSKMRSKSEQACFVAALQFAMAFKLLTLRWSASRSSRITLLRVFARAIGRCRGQTVKAEA